MSNVNYNIYDINTGEIWQYERERLKTGGDITFYDQFLRIIEPIIVQNCSPIVTEDEEVNSGNLKYSLDFHKRYSERQVDYFESEGAYYDFKDNCVVRLMDYNQRDFGFLFAYKLRQYQDNLAESDTFLYYQLKINFKKSLQRFMSFIRSLLIQFPDMLAGPIEKKIDLWEKTFDPALLVDEKVYDIYDHPEHWTAIRLSMTDDQLRAYFSFLYLEKNNLGLPFLEKNLTDRLLKFGLRIPPKPLAQKYELNQTSVHRKSIIEQSVYVLFEKHSLNFKDKLEMLEGV